MKHFVLVISFLGASIVSFSQMKAQETAKISTPDALCEACKARIESYLKRIDGVVYINVNYRKGETTVKYLTARTNIEIIKTAIANVGYDADNITANEDSYKRLPKTCKKPEDGGAHPKRKTPVPTEPAQ
jgi:copper chaperone CopZ